MNEPDNDNYLSLQCTSLGQSHQGGTEDDPRQTKKVVVGRLRRLSQRLAGFNNQSRQVERKDGLPSSGRA